MFNLASTMYESAGKSHHGRITKRGSNHLRTTHTEAAHAAARR